LILAGVLALFAGAHWGAPWAQAQRSVDCALDVVVQAGDTLSTLSSRYYGSVSDYHAIVEATNAIAAADNSYARIDSPDLLRQGWKLCIPGPIAVQDASITRATSIAAAPPAAQPTAGELGAFIRRFAQLSVENLRRKEYNGGAIVLEQTLAPRPNHNRYVVSYRSEGLKIYALLTVPTGDKPLSGWPVIIFNHGYTPPDLYQTTVGYEEHIHVFASNGYIVLRPDYRGHGNSEGEAMGGYDAPAYTIDVLNAIASIKQHPDVDPERIGMWGHSLGGYITLYSMVVRNEVKAGVIWAGVVGSYADMLALWDEQSVWFPPQARQWRTAMFALTGTPAENPAFWNSISATNYLADLSGPLQLHHSRIDESVPVEFSTRLSQQIEAAGETVETYVYGEDNHNLSNNFASAMERSLAFFDYYLKPKG
jgi:dienelactone hydrolase